MNGDSESYWPLRLVSSPPAAECLIVFPLPRKVARTLALCLRPDWKWERAGTPPPCGCHRVSRQLNERAASLALGGFNWRSLTRALLPSRRVSSELADTSASERQWDAFKESQMKE